MNHEKLVEIIADFVRGVNTHKSRGKWLKVAGKIPDVVEFDKEGKFKRIHEVTFVNPLTKDKSEIYKDYADSERILWLAVPEEVMDVFDRIVVFAPSVKGIVKLSKGGPIVECKCGNDTFYVFWKELKRPEFKCKRCGLTLRLNEIPKAFK